MKYVKCEKGTAAHRPPSPLDFGRSGPKLLRYSQMLHTKYKVKVWVAFKIERRAGGWLAIFMKIIGLEQG